MSEIEIQAGDIVVCYPSENTMIDGRVLYCPCTTGDAWHIKGNDGKLYYVQTYLYIVKA